MLLLLATTGCGRAGIATDNLRVAPTDGGADAVAGDARAAAPTCPVTAPTSVRAGWRMPDPTAAASADNLQSYQLIGDDLAIDRVTRLTWQRRPAADAFTWQEATSYCACLTLAGFDDWRLPTRIELVSLVDITHQAPAINTAAFPDTPDLWFWTSSLVAGDAASAWYVAFFDGNTHFQGQDARYQARCVRSAPVVSAPLAIRDDDTVFDPNTQLTWQRTADATLRPWAQAPAACAALSLAGEAAWRLPSAKELETLVDETAASPAIDLVAFPAAGADSFWASTPLAGGGAFHWFTNFDHGIAYNSADQQPHRTRCVR